MFSSKPRGPRIVYVAASARELPEEVQQWLSQPEHRAASSPHIYDALALLASGARPAVMIVSIGAVDWSEMAFFDQAARVSRYTHIYVAGHDHDSAKLEAACHRGASRFDPEHIGEVLAAPAPWNRGVRVTDILAAKLRPAAPHGTAPMPAIRPVPPEPVEAEDTDDTEAVPAPTPEPQPEPAQATPVRLVDTPESESVEPEPEEETEQPIPFPWSPSPNRPQRTPPKAGPAIGHGALTPGVEPPPVSAVGSIPLKPVELTSEELSALMGKPVRPEQQARENRS